MGKDRVVKDEKKDFNMEATRVMPKPGEPDSGGGKALKVRPKEEAMALILEALQKTKGKGDELGIDVDTFGGQDAVEPVLDALYNAYEENGTVPSREGFAELCGDKGLAEFVLDMPRDPFVKKPVRKGRVAAICAGCVAAVAIVGCGVMFALGQGGTPAPTPAPAGSAAVEAQEDEVAYLIHIGVSAEGWDAATSSPVIAHIVNKAEGIDYYHAFAANEDTALEVPTGGYEVSFITPVNADGSIYRVPGTQTVTAVADDGGSGAENGDLPFKFERVAPKDVTADELTGIIGQVTEAIEKRDETLTGEAGAGVAQKVEENCKANPNADKKAVEEEGNKAAEATQAPSSAQTGGSGSTGGSGGSGSGSSSSASGGSNSKPSGGSSSSGSGGSSSGTGGSGTSNPKPSHTHNWVAQTTTVHHDAVYETVHHDAVVEEHYICNGCSADITSDPYGHAEDALLNGNTGCGAWHSEFVTVQPAYDEQVLVSEAWDETVTTGYTCSSCGATK